MEPAWSGYEVDEMTDKNKDVLDALDELADWANKGADTCAKGKTVPDIFSIKQTIRDALSSPQPEKMYYPCELRTMHKDMVLVPIKVVKFLCGERKLDGMYFGEFPDNGEKYKRRYWWRRYLRADARKDES